MVSRAAKSSLREVRLDSDDADWTSTGLQKLLLFAIANALPFAELMTKVLNSATQPLRLILYADGITPGNPLGGDNKRKSIVWYASFLEFGNLLCHEECWFTLASALTLVVKTTPAGVSDLTRRILREL